jgi:hypothetical protein
MGHKASHDRSDVIVACGDYALRILLSGALPLASHITGMLRPDLIHMRQRAGKVMPLNLNFRRPPSIPH